MAHLGDIKSGSTKCTDGMAAEQTEEVRDRTAADIRELTEAFRKARENGDRAVVVMTQADMFDPTVSAPAQENYSAFMLSFERIPFTNAVS
ncbi:hypothetical protein [Arthrobacter sp. OAP107]|uniref:hypothetical protein n=1 Tax=Arthrobacter sp. OAP107 TaxID=3156445 RepID=UPI003393C489